MTDVFTTFSEVYRALEQYMLSVGAPPRQISLPTVLYFQLLEIQAEQAMLAESEFPCYIYLTTDYGDIPVVLDDQLPGDYISLE
ncbi:MAG: hypothetical protein U0264_12365 [Candidatus Kapaibacterium sp.]